MDQIFILNNDQRAILKSVAQFVEQEVKPRAAQLDANQDPEKCYSFEIIEKAHEAGTRTMTLSEQLGGLGADSLTTAMVIEELAKGERSEHRASRCRAVCTYQAARNAERGLLALSCRTGSC